MDNLRPFMPFPAHLVPVSAPPAHHPTSSPNQHPVQHGTYTTRPPTAHHPIPPVVPSMAPPTAHCPRPPFPPVPPGHLQLHPRPPIPYPPQLPMPHFMPPPGFQSQPPPAAYNPPLPQMINEHIPVPLPAYAPMQPPELPVVPYCDENNLNIQHPFPANIPDLKVKQLEDFLARFTPKASENKKSSMSVAEFRSALKIAFVISKVLTLSHNNLSKLVHCEEDVWKAEVERMSAMKNQLTEVCTLLSNPNNFLIVQEKLKKIKKRREKKRRAKQNYFSLKRQRELERSHTDHEIDRWLDTIKEKNLKLKRETEMKKEATNILSEVRRKIQEAKRVLEKLKVLEKLRNARKENAIHKGLYVLPQHTESFEESVNKMKETMRKQLADYEAEEKALKVMLETEQEGQLEEEAQWRLKKRKQIQQKRQKDIYEALFGDRTDPVPGDPLYYFWMHHTAGQTSLDNLVQIRHLWDIFLVPPGSEGSVLPHHWVVPQPPNNESWDVGICS